MCRRKPWYRMWTDMKNEVLTYLPADCPYRGSLYSWDCLESTNTTAKRLAFEGASHGTVVLAKTQKSGRGRMGRTFFSPEGNLYFSMLLKTQCKPQQLMHLTCWAGVMVCDAVQALTGIRPGIKWINDLVVEGKKLGGILTELVLNPQTGLADYAVVGIGINCLHIPQQVADMATSLSEMTHNLQSPAPMAAMLAQSMWQGDWRKMPARYRTDCITLGQDVKLMQTGAIAKALDVTDQGALLVQLADGTRQEVSSGEVSVRGMYGYV